MSIITDYIVPSYPSQESQHPGFYIITGGPGVGKTSIIQRLKDTYYVVAEAATDVISKELAEGVSAPWAKEGFREKIVRLQLQRQQETVAQKTNIVFFDRSPIDTFSYCLHLNAIPTPELQQAVQKTVTSAFYSKTVFLIENLGRTQQTEIRCEQEDEAIVIRNKIAANYKALGFEVVSIPRGTIEERVQKIVSHVAH